MNLVSEIIFDLYANRSETGDRQGSFQFRIEETGVLTSVRIWHGGGSLPRQVYIGLRINNIAVFPTVNEMILINSTNTAFEKSGLSFPVVKGQAASFYTTDSIDSPGRWLAIIFEIETEV